MPTFLACIERGLGFGAGFAALARVTDDPAQGDWIAERARMLAAAAEPPRDYWPPTDSAYRAARAALAVGFLRRSDPARRFAPEAYDRWRAALLPLAADRRQDRDIRACAYYAIALLGGMPTLRTGSDTMATWLLASLRADDPEALVRKARWLALSAQTPDTVPPEGSAAVRSAAFAKTFEGRRLDVEEAEAAATAFARMARPEDLPPFLAGRVLRSPADRCRDVMAALVERAPRLPAASRRELEALIGADLERKRTEARQDRLLLLLGRLVEADAREGVVGTEGSSPDLAARRLLDAVREGAGMPSRPCAILAAGWVVQAIGTRTDGRALASRRDAFLSALRRIVDDAASADSDRAAAAMALGLARSSDDEERFVRLLSDTEAPVYARSCAAWALGLLPAWGSTTLEALRREADAPFWDVLSERAAVAGARSGAVADAGRRHTLVAHEPSGFGRATLAREAGRWADGASAKAFAAQATDVRVEETERWMALTALAEWADPDPRAAVDRLGEVCGTGSAYWGFEWDDEAP